MDKYDIIILGGQSNAEGCGIGPVDKEYEPNSDILYLEAEKTVVVNPEGMHITYKKEPFIIKEAEERLSDDGLLLGDLSLTFAKQYINNGLLHDGRKLLIIRAAIGGTGFKKRQWGLNDKVYLKMLEMTDYALSLNSENKIVAFLWHQGEHDAFEGNAPENYKRQLNSLLAGVRSRYGEIPFIAGDFVHEWKSKNVSICEPIIKAINEVVAQNNKCGFVETADLPSNNQKIGNGDDIHFCRQSLYVLGERYFEMYKMINQVALKMKEI